MQAGRRRKRKGGIRQVFPYVSKPAQVGQGGTAGPHLHRHGPRLFKAMAVGHRESERR